AGPFPHIPGNIEQAVAVRRKLRDRRDPDEVILTRITIREVDLVGVRPPDAFAGERVAPRVEFAAQAAARREFPLGFGREALARPFRVGLRVLVGDMDHRISLLALDRAAGPLRVTPTRALHVRPPLKMVVERNWMIG